MPVELGLVNNAMEEEMRRGAEAENAAFDEAWGCRFPSQNIRLNPTSLRMG